MIRKSSKIIFFAYLITLGWILFFQPTRNFSRIENRTHQQQHNLIPLKTLKRYVQTFPDYYKHHGLKTWMMNVAGNILMYLPFGFLLPLIGWIRPNFPIVIGAAILFSTTTEIMQFFLRVGIMDVDDVLLNTLGTIVGWLGYIALRAFLSILKISS